MTKTSLADFSPAGNNVVLYADAGGAVPANDGDDVLRIDSADGLPLGTARVARKTLYTRTMLFMLPIAFADDFRRWLWAIGRQDEPTEANPGTVLREFSATGDAPATHVGMADNITEDERLAIWSANAASRTNEEWARFGLDRVKVRALFDNWQRASVERDSAEVVDADQFVIRDVDVGRTLAQMKRVAERVIERQQGRSRDPLSQWARRQLTPALVEIERQEQP